MNNQKTTRNVSWAIQDDQNRWLKQTSYYWHWSEDFQTYNRYYWFENQFAATFVYSHEQLLEMLDEAEKMGVIKDEVVLVCIEKTETITKQSFVKQAFIKANNLNG